MDKLTVVLIFSLLYSYSWFQGKVIQEKEETEFLLNTKVLTLEQLVSKQDTIIKRCYDHVLRMQIIAGVDTIDNVFTYKEKILNPINTKSTLYWNRFSIE